MTVFAHYSIAIFPIGEVKLSNHVFGFDGVQIPDFLFPVCVVAFIVQGIAQKSSVKRCSGIPRVVGVASAVWHAPFVIIVNLAVVELGVVAR